MKTALAVLGLAVVGTASSFIPAPWAVVPTVACWGLAGALVLHKYLPSEPAAKQAESKGGLTVQCMHCRRVRAVDQTWFEPLVGPDPATTTTGICPDCYQSEMAAFERLMKHGGV